MLRIILFVLFLNHYYCLQTTLLELLPYNEPLKCNRSEYFNLELLQCQVCDVNKFLVPAYDKHDCICNEKSQTIYDASKSIMIECAKCKANSIFSKIINTCIRCTNGVYKKDNITLCKPCKDNEIMVYQYPNGTYLSQTRCISCTNGMIPSEDKRYCMPCPILNPIKINATIKCMCDYKSTLVGNLCIPSNLWPELTNLKNKYYLQYNNGEKIESQLFESLLKRNIFLCKLKNTTACQIIANLCTLTLFTSYNNSPCNFWMLESKYFMNPETLITLPWLIYREGDANIILNRKIISAKYSLDPTSLMSRLNLTAVVIHLNGTVKEVKTLLGSDINLCPDLNYIKNEVLRFGINYKDECYVEAQQLLQNRETEFFLPYLHYWNNGEPVLYAIPVLIRNLPNNNKDISHWLLVRRFFMFDTISSILRNTNKPTFIKYMKSIQINIKLRNDADNGMIYPPLIIIEYGEVEQTELISNKKLKFQFSINYEMNTNFKYSIEIAIGILSALAILYSGIQTWSYSRRSGYTTIDLSSLFRLVIFTCGNLANAFYLVAFAACLHTFIFYKGQSVVHLLLPTEDQENIIKYYIIVAFSLKIVEIGVLIWQQISVDIFLIDWERPRPQDAIPRPKNKLAASPFTLSSSSERAVSIWRSYFIANEWNEIQTLRKTNMLIHMFLITFLLKVIGLEYWGTSDPELHTAIPEHLKYISFSFVCRFAVGSLIYVIIYLLQLVIMVGFYERYIKNAIQQFVDVCSLANISVFIMSHERYGHYIHGRSSHGFADTDMATMIQQLKREEDDLCAYRGLLAGTHHQTFSVGVPAKLRLYYNKLMQFSKNIQLNAMHVNLIGMSPNKHGQMEAFEKTILAYHNVNKFLSAFLEHALKDFDYDVKDKNFLEYLLDVEFTDCFERGVLYTDNGHSFDNVLFYGNDFSLFTFDIMVYSIVLMLSDDFIVAILVTLSISEILKMVRNIGGKRNLAQKTLIDERFLI